MAKMNYAISLYDAYHQVIQWTWGLTNLRFEYVSSRFKWHDEMKGFTYLIDTNIIKPGHNMKFPSKLVAERFGMQITGFARTVKGDGSDFLHPRFVTDFAVVAAHANEEHSGEEFNFVDEEDLDLYRLLVNNGGMSIVGVHFMMYQYNGEASQITRQFYFKDQYMSHIL
jgi:hypothetical protein